VPFLRQLLASRFEPLAAAAATAAAAAHAATQGPPTSPPPPLSARKRRRAPPPPEWPALEAALRDAAADGVQALEARRSGSS
jgi:hypothetical protein